MMAGYYVPNAIKLGTEMRNDYKIEYLKFSLLVEEDWPPVQVESLPTKKVEGFFEVIVPPFFLQDLSCGDIITVRKNNDRVTSWSHIYKSQRSTIWLLDNNSYEQLEVYLENLKNLGCNIERLEKIGLFSIDVPENIDVEEIINYLEEEDVAVAYPSYRLNDTLD